MLPAIRTVAILLLLTCHVACTKHTDDSAQQVIRVGATPVPHEEILRRTQGMLAKQGIKLEIVVFNDYVQPNLRLMDGDLDANYYQTLPYLENFVKDRHAAIVSIGKIHYEPFALYSQKHKSLKDIPEHAMVAVPNEPSNRVRALRLLERAGLIKLNPSITVLGSDKDISENSHNLVIKELDPAMLPRVLDSADIVGINANFALTAGLVPGRDGLLVEDESSPYANALVVRRVDQDKPALRALLIALQSNEIKDFIKRKYNGAVLPY